MINTKHSLLNYWNKIEENQTIRLEEIKQTRSQWQNRLYWAYISDLTKCFDEKGIFITQDDLHEWLRQKLIKWRYKTNPITWNRMIIRKSTAKLNKKEFSTYIKDIEKYMIQTYEIACPLRTDINY